MQSTYDGPKLVQDAAYSLDAFYRTGSLRRAVEAQIEHLIDFLDYIDTDPDLEEPGDAEPSLGYSEMEARFDWYPPHANDDLELEHDGTEPDADLEPSLGWTRTGAIGNCLDLEEAAL